LMLTDVLHLLAQNPLLPCYTEAAPSPAPVAAPPSSWQEFPAALTLIGHDGISFFFDNEQPRHRVFLESYALASRLVTNTDMFPSSKMAVITPPHSGFPKAGTSSTPGTSPSRSTGMQPKQDGNNLPLPGCSSAVLRPAAMFRQRSASISFAGKPASPA